MDHWYPKKIFISEKDIILNGYALSYYFKEGTREKTVLASEVVNIKEKGFQYSRSYIIKGYLKKFIKENRELFSDIDIIIPVPGNIYSNKRIENLTDYLGEILEKPVLNLIKNKSESSSYGKNKLFEIEYQNKRRKFSLQEDFSKVKNKKILLFDDITTTGATLVICGKELKRMEAREVVPFTLCTSRMCSRI
jgi:competence protein ComFC